jgi:hypothetical protein
MERHRPAAVAILGDDRSDAEAFRVVAMARSAGRLAQGLTIGVHRAADTPPDVVHAADVMLPDPAATGPVLRALARRLEEEVPAGARRRTET